MLVAIERLRPDSTPVRTRRHPDDEAAMLASMTALGQLEPIIVARLGDDFDEAPLFEVKDGNTRLVVAQKLGWQALEVAELPRRTPEFLAAAATAANTVRAALPPADQWRAIVTMQQRGRSLADAAAALGLSERQAARLDRLGRLHPDMLALIEEVGLPYGNHLATIAAAPPAKQAAALKAKGGVERPKLGGAHVTWHIIASACADQRIPRARAIFDAAATGLAWEQDFFAPEGSDEEWTTSDVAGFLDRQRAALAALAEASKGRLVLAEESTRHPGEVVLPKGWKETQGNPDKPKKTETVFAIVTARGSVVRSCAIDAAAEKARQKAAEKKAKPDPKEQDKARLAPDLPAVPSAIGTIDTPLHTMPAGAASGGAGDDDERDEGDQEEPAAPPPTAEARHPLTKAGQKILAGYKTQALRTVLRDRTVPIDSDTLIALLILALHAPNVSVQSYDAPADGTHYGARRGHDLVRRLVTPAGHLQFDEAELPILAGEALARTLSFSEPDEGSYNGRSGATAEWAGAAIGAAARLPRVDTAELLATADATTLRAAALAAGHKFTTAAAAKRDLPGKVEAWAAPFAPPWAHFGAPGPKPAGRDAA
jgi:ParB family transcriptional regulator, chromosome partitioning protein